MQDNKTKLKNFTNRLPFFAALNNAERQSLLCEIEEYEIVITKIVQ